MLDSIGASFADSKFDQINFQGVMPRKQNFADGFSGGLHITGVTMPAFFNQESFFCHSF